MTENSITWHWNAVEGAIGYAVQVSADEMFDATDTITPTVETSFTASDLPPSTTLYGRVAAAAGSLEAPLLSDWTTHVTGMTPAPGAPVPPPAPSGLRMSSATGTSITWSWDAVMEADGYHVQFNTEEGFDGVEPVATMETSHTQTDLSEGMAGYLRVRSTAGDLTSMWTAHLTAMTRITPPPPMNLMATATEDSITWTWDEVEGADGYHIQYSADGVFTGSTEAMEAEGTSYTKDGLTIGTSAFLRVRSAAGTGDQVVLMSGWTMPTKGTTMTPQPPPVPTGLAAEGGAGSITWTWDAVAGATGYEVQFSTDPGFPDAETMMVEEGTSYTRMELDASTRGYLRVRAVNDAGSSDWAPTASGTTDAAVVTKEPLSVTFTTPDSEFPMNPDGEDDQAKAKATVNKKITVMSSDAATITPMFEPDANGQSLAEGDGNTPFAFVTWSAMQSAVVSDAGATFKITRAGTTGEKAGDVAYVTCGPFECTDSSNEGPPAALGYDITESAKCEAWDPDVELRVGYIDNSVNDDADTADVNERANDGVDVGWVYESTLDVKVKHVFAEALGGKNYTASGFAADATSRDTPLAMTDAARADGGPNSVPAFNPGLLVDYASQAEGGAEDIPVNCAPDDEYALRRGTLQKPEECFRIVTANPDGGTLVATDPTSQDPDYLEAYTLMLEPQGADLGTAWGSKVNWKTDPFKAYTCPAMPFKATEYIEADVCDILFQDELDTALAAGWGVDRGSGTDLVEGITFTTNTDGDADGDLDDLNADPSDAGDDVLGSIKIAAPVLDERTQHRTRFATLWFSNNDEGKNPADTDLYVDTVDDVAGTASTLGIQPAPLLYDLLDTDNDPIDGDFGKVDLNKDGKADNHKGDEEACSDGDEGDDCNAKFSRDIVVKFASGTALGCTESRTVTLTCDWNAAGELGRYRADDHDSVVDVPGTANTIGNQFGGFETDGRSGTRIAGYIGAFADCKIEK